MERLARLQKYMNKESSLLNIYNIVIVKRWQPRCLTIELKTLLLIYTEEYYAAIIKNEVGNKSGIYWEEDSKMQSSMYNFIL